jgi:hypothetical protein
MRKFRGTLKIRFSYSEYVGPRYHRAGVVLRLQGSDEYKFENAAQWTEADFGHIVEKAIRDGLQELDYDPDLGIFIVLEEVEYDSLDSSERSFYVAAKAAIKSRDVLSM